MSAETTILNLLPENRVAFLDAPDVVEGEHDVQMADLSHLEMLLYGLDKGSRGGELENGCWGGVL